MMLFGYRGFHVSTQCKLRVVVFMSCGLFTIHASVSQNSVQLSPSSSQTITQPGGTSFNIQGVVDIGAANPTAPLTVSGVNGSSGPTMLVTNPGATCAGCNFIGAQIVANGNAGGYSSANTALYVDAENGASNFAAVFANGNVGVNALYPSGLLTIGSPAADGAGTPNQGILFIDTVVGGGDTWTHGAIYTVGSSGYNGDLVFATDGDGLPNYNPTEKMRVTYNGNVGIGTSTPQAKLDVTGNIRISGSGSFITFPDGTMQSTAYVGTTCPTGGDYAESVDVTGDRNIYEPGDVMVVDPSSPGHVLKSSTPYSTLVAGIYSTKPGFVGRRQTTDPKTATSEIPMAMVGVVPTKVSTENGPIRVGDLLVTSSTMGYAMKGTDKAQLVGAVVGKAFGNLDSGTGVVEVLVTLQ